MTPTCDRRTLDVALSALRASKTPAIGDADRPAFFLHALAAMRKHAGPQTDPISIAFRNALILRDRCGFTTSGQVEPWWIAAYLLSVSATDSIYLDESCPNSSALAQVVGIPQAPASEATIALFGAFNMAAPILTRATRVLRLYETGVGDAIVRLPNGAVIEIDDPSIKDHIDISIAAYEPGEIAKLSAIPRRSNELRAAPDVKSSAYDELTSTRREAERRTVSPIYDAYTPRRATFSGAQPHPAALVESKTLSSIEPPPLKNTLKLDKALIASGLLSGAQLEGIALADAAHGKLMPSGSRFGFFLADGTGVGKTNIQIGLYLNNYNHGRRRMIYISEKNRHIVNVEKAITMLGMPRRLVIDCGAYSVTDSLPSRDGVVFITYSRLRECEDGENFLRIKQLVDWFGDSSNGLVVFDECHNLRNAIGDPNVAVFSQPPSLQGQAGVVLQDMLPNARILYASATGVSDLYNLAYMNRLALWGPGSEFSDINEFLDKFQKTGVSGLELIATHLAASGLMIARTLSLEGVRAETLVHHFSDQEITDWDNLAELLATLRNALPEIWRAAISKAIDKKFNPEPGWIPQEAVAHFESASRRLAELALVSTNTPTVIADMKLALDRGDSPVIQLTNTYEAEAESDAATLHATIQRLVDQVVPTVAMQKLTSSSSRARLNSFRATQNSNGQPIEIPQNVAFRKMILEKAANLASPRPPLDQIIETFGVANIAEITGRTRRRAFDPTTGLEEVEIRNETSVRADLASFMGDRKRILVFSTGAGGSSMDYHAANDVRNRRVRRHYLLQPGHRADQALQGIGRTHRSNQAQPPVVVLVSSDLPAERVYRSRTLARIRKLGASTQGHRDANSAAFNMRESYDNEYARAAFVRFLVNMTSNTYPDLMCAAFEQSTHMKLVEKGKAIYTANEPFFRRLLTRLARCNLTVQRTAFNHIDGELEQTLSKAIVDRTFDTGPEHISDVVEVISQKTLLTEPHTGAVITATTISGAKHSKLLSLDDAIAEAETYDILGRMIRWAWSPETSRPFIQVAIEEDNAGYIKSYRVIEPERSRTLDWLDPELLKSERISTGNVERMKLLWDMRIESIQDLASKPSVILSGALPLIYGVLCDEDGLKRPVIADTSDGRRLMGVLTTPEHAATIGIGAKTAAIRVSTSTSVSHEVDKILAETAAGKTAVFANNWMLNNQVALGKMRLELHVPTAERATVEKATRSIGFAISKLGQDVRFLLPENIAAKTSVRAILAQAPFERFDDQPDWSLVA